mgnify:CR=1 FL=1
MNKSYFLDKHGLFIEDLLIGQSKSFEKEITDNDIKIFSEITGDKNPVHTDDKFAKETIFKKRIAHGFLTGSLISTVIATKLPGPGSVYLKQDIKFLAPVFIGDTVKAKVTVLEIMVEKKKVKLTTECFVLEKKVLEGSAEILVSSKSDL